MFDLLEQELPDPVDAVRVPRRAGRARLRATITDFATARKILARLSSEDVHSLGQNAVDGRDFPGCWDGMPVVRSRRIDGGQGGVETGHVRKAVSATATPSVVSSIVRLVGSVSLAGLDVVLDWFSAQEK